MLASETFEAVRLVMTQLLLTGLKFHPIEGLMYLAPACTLWLLIGSFTLELRPMLASGAFGVVAAKPLKFMLAAAMGFGVNSLAYIIIQTASSLTLKVLGTVKNAFVVWLGIVLLGDQMTIMQGGGYALSIAAFYWYQKIKMEQIKAGSGAVKVEQQGKPGDGVIMDQIKGGVGGTGLSPTLRRGNSASLSSGKFDIENGGGGGGGGDNRTPRTMALKEQV